MKQFFYLSFLLFFLTGCVSKLEPMAEDVVTIPEIGDRDPSVENKVPALEKTPPVSVPDDKYFGLWWRYLGSAELEMLIDRSLANNQQLQIAAQRIVQAKARSIQDRASTLPEVTMMGGYTLDAPAGGLGSVPKGSSPRSSDEFEVGLNARYTVDLWGQRASLVDASEFRLQQAIYQYDAQLLQVITDLSKNYLAYLSLNDRIRNAEESEKALLSMLSAMEDLYEQGDATVVEMQIQRSSVFNTRVVLPTLQLDRDQLANRIARLVGVAPGELNLSNDGLDSLSFPAKITGISSAYLLRRPDIQAIESGLLAADADLDVARKAVLPSFDLGAGISFGANNASELFQPHTLMWNFVANLTTTIFDGGVKEQEIKFAQAVRSELVETYVFNVYSGLQQAKDALYEISYTDRRLQMQEASTKAAKEALDLGFEAYSVGGIDFLTFLDSTHSYQKRRDELYTFSLEYYQAFIDLYGALGGGIPYRGNLPRKNTAQTDAASFVELANKTYTEGSRWPKGEIGWLDKPEEYKGSERWLVRLTGVYDGFATESILKDFRRRYKSLAPAQALLAERIGFNDQEKDNQAAWYALAISGFDSKSKADKWCDMLRNTQQRCVVYMPDDVFEVDGVFLVDKSYKSLSLAQILENSVKQKETDVVELEKAVESKKAVVVDSNSLALKETENKFGRLYSLLRSDGDHAWLIGNNTYRVWKYRLNSKLHHDGHLVNVEKDQVILQFGNNGFRLKPLYVVDNIEEKDDGSLLANLRWGGRVGRIYSHHLGDRVYGGGVIKKIDASGVVISWGAHDIFLQATE